MSDFSAVHEAAERGEWRQALDALDALAAAGAEVGDAEGLELRARAAYGAGDFEASVAAWEDLHALLMADGDMAGAAWAASMVAMYLMMDTGLMAPVRGWLRRADRLLEGHAEAPARAIVAVVRGYERFMCGDMEAAGDNAAMAIELGTRLGVAPAVVIGRVCTARVTIFDGQVAEGLDLLDEIALDLMSGAVDPLTTGMMYCELICAAQGMALHDRASEWTDVMERWRHGAAIGGISGRCRVHRAEMLRISGPCDQAEAEALGACDELRPWMRREFGWPLVELGNIRLRRGDLAGAEEAFMAAHERAWSPQPGLALLRLAQGDIDAASTMIADAIAHPVDIPWKERPPFGDLRLAPLLDAQAEIAAAAGDVDNAAAGRRGTGVDRRLVSEPVARRSGGTRGCDVPHCSSGDLDRAIHEATAAIAAWSDIGAPFEAAAARLVLGEAQRRAGNADAAHMEWRAAQSAFEAFGAVRWAIACRRPAHRPRIGLAAGSIRAHGHGDVPVRRRHPQDLLRRTDRADARPQGLSLPRTVARRPRPRVPRARPRRRRAGFAPDRTARPAAGEIVAIRCRSRTAAARRPGTRRPTVGVWPRSTTTSRRPPA